MMKTFNSLMILALMFLALSVGFGGIAAASADRSCGDGYLLASTQCQPEDQTSDSGMPPIFYRYAVAGERGSYVTDVDRGGRCADGGMGSSGDKGSMSTEDDSGIWIGHGRIAGHIV